ncbi:MAG: hypothetical protein ACD_4C00113G0004 [uncultured bacterium (gcode 4)]|uniref:Uncharacterized protein n=1 Tax=uncultured bacterium (gcode 4) TaxID=1234023 RepID=K2FVE9_9BACT|nr:MAG: hypothetical protein ACD_4C00113G0004 [uncultured bacterium (gcode 4)]
MKKYKILAAFIIFLSYSSIWISYAGVFSDMWTSIKNSFDGKDLKTDMIVWQKSNLIEWKDTVDTSLGVDKHEVNFSDNFIKVIERYIFWLLWLTTVSVFIYIWYMLFTAEWKEDEFKKALKALTYAVVWLAVIPLSYIVIKIISGLNF